MTQSNDGDQKNVQSQISDSMFDIKILKNELDLMKRFIKTSKIEEISNILVKQHNSIGEM